MINIISKVINRLRWYKTKCFLHRNTKTLTQELLKTKGQKTIYLFCVPLHSNLGDQAQLSCWIKLLHVWYPSHKLVMIPQLCCNDQIISIIKRNITENDIILIHSGYLLYDPHPNLPLIVQVVETFQNHRITILPQTINLVNPSIQKRVCDVFNRHKSLTLLCRDETSLKIAGNLFSNIRLKLYPDVVTSLIGDEIFSFANKRKGVLLCVRNDGEKYYSQQQINNLRKRLKGFKVSVKDTTIRKSESYWIKNRDKLVYDFIKMIADYELVITDRFHGTIFSQIAKTPTIVISSIDHKLSSGVRWFDNGNFNGLVHFADDLDEAYEIAVKILHGPSQKNYSNKYFKQTYWDTPIC